MDNCDTVLITGASSGIGYELAKIFAENHYNLILVSRSIDKLNVMSEEFKKSYDVCVYVIKQDLSIFGASKVIFDKVKELSVNVSILINDAGFGSVGMFHEAPIEKDIQMIQVNISALTELTKLFAGEMVKRKKGRILNVASTGAFYPGPYTAVYYATKAYVLSFSQAISRELEPFGVNVSTLCPGATKTNFAKSEGKRDSKISMSARSVAKIAYDGLLKNKKIIVPGFRNKLALICPRNFGARFIERYQKNLSNKL